MKKVITLLLLAALITSAFSCGESSGAADDITASGGNDTTASAETEPVDALAARQLIDDELPEKDFGGKKYRVMTDEPNALLNNYVMVEEATGDVVDDAVFARNRDVEERFNVKIDVTYIPNSTAHSEFSKLVLAGEDAVDIFGTNIVQMGALLLNDYYMNWSDVPNVDFDKPWWSPSTTTDLTYKDKCYIAVGDYFLGALQATYCMYYNKRLAEDYSIDGVYDAVMSDKWTIDKLIGFTKDIYTDVNSNDGKDQDDFYGLCVNASSNANTFLWAFGNRVIANNNGKLEVVYKSEKTNDIVTKLVSMYNDNPGISYNLSYKDSLGNTQFPYPRDMFLNSKAIFATGQIVMAISHFRDMKDDFGIIPYPKWDENQKEYYTMVDGSHSGMAIPVTVTDPEMVGIVTEALCAGSYKSVIPAYYDTALKVKGARDETSVEILDMIVNGRIFDMGYVYDSFNGASFIIQSLVRNANSNFESTWASKESAIMAHYANVIAYFEGK